MSSASKTLDLLSHFSATRPEIGLSQFCRLAARDKATTYRHLQALEEAGFVEQNPDTKRYRLGPVVLRLALVREATVPRKAGAQDVLAELATATGETCHVSVLSGQTLFALTSCESDTHSTRVIIDIDTFPLHATASGLCALAFGPSDLMQCAAAQLDRFTKTTATDLPTLEAQVATTRNSGIAHSAGGFQADTDSFGAPLFDAAGHCAGAVSVACVSTRMTPQLAHRIPPLLVAASRQITHNWGGTTPAHVEHAWARSPGTAQDIAS